VVERIIKNCGKKLRQKNTQKMDGISFLVHAVTEQGRSHPMKTKSGKKKFTMWMVGCPWKELAVRNKKIPKMFYMSKKSAVYVSKQFKIENHPYPEPVMKCTVVVDEL
jgi:hypothetical protein